MDGTLTGVYPYGGELFRMSLIVSMVTPFPITSLDPYFGPKNYTFYTIGHNGSNLHYSGKASKQPKLWRIICGYSYEIEIEGEIIDKFDFVPDRSWKRLSDVVYNAAATLWSSIYNDFLGASHPEVKMPIHEIFINSGSY